MLISSVVQLCALNTRVVSTVGPAVAGSAGCGSASAAAWFPPPRSRTAHPETSPALASTVPMRDCLSFARERIADASPAAHPLACVPPVAVDETSNGKAMKRAAQGAVRNRSAGHAILNGGGSPVRYTRDSAPLDASFLRRSPPGFELRASWPPLTHGRHGSTLKNPATNRAVEPAAGT